MKNSYNIFIVGILIFQFSFSSVELPIGFTDKELTMKHLIKNVGNQTDPPQMPIRNIAEFERMHGVLIRYPFGISTALIKEMADDVVVYCLVSSSYQSSAYNSMFNAGVNMNNVEFILGSTDSYWTRDYGPWWVVDGDRNISIVDFTYNRPRFNDNAAPSKVSNYLGAPYFSADFISTGGNYMTNGYGVSAGTHIAYTENNECNTNDEWSVPLAPCDYVDDIMENYYGINKNHIVADPNNEYIDHIDCWGKFLSFNKILIRDVPSSHPQHDELDDIANYFSKQTTLDNVPFEIYRVYTPDDQPYTNSLILNEKVLVPITNSSWDDDALDVYAAAMPGYEILGFTGSWQSTDALHCRVKGIPDLEMIQILHNPISNQLEPLDSYKIIANIDDLGNQGLNNDALKVIWWNSEENYQELPLSDCSNDNFENCYEAFIPGQPYDGTINYFIYVENNIGKIETYPIAGYFTFDYVGGDPLEDGDVNLDGSINILDVVVIVNFVLGTDVPDVYQLQIADINDDSIINILDIIMLVNIILGGK